MECLQCYKPATKNGEVYDGADIRECEDGHRTARIEETRTYLLQEAA